MIYITQLVAKVGFILLILNNYMKLEYVFNWLWLSSSDPSKISLTIKGLSGYIVPALVMFLGWDAIAAGGFVSDVAALAATGITVIGLGRKIYLTWQGQNKAL